MAATKPSSAAAVTRTPEKTLGVLGGMGPTATAEFLRLLAAGAPATEDQQHPRIVLLSEPGIPDRTDALLSGDDEPARRVREGLFTLAGWGAGLLAIPCNTAHAFLGRTVAELPVPLVDIVDATLAEAMRLSPAGGWLTATTGTLASGLYQERAAALGYRLHIPDGGTQKLIHDSAMRVKANRIEEAARTFRAAVQSLWLRREVPVLAACTELPIAYQGGALPPEMAVSSLSALARACNGALYGPARFSPRHDLRAAV
ncbi:amino acid racemase [Streptomyces sp. NPDC046261]|uniref:aspartate/glutamate racemase family protein n=1 Tax=Streptomyces sp. NPDC046261 TaxID=3157200 RepID=UPI0033D674A8